MKNSPFLCFSVSFLLAIQLFLILYLLKGCANSVISEMTYNYVLISGASFALSIILVSRLMYDDSII